MARGDVRVGILGASGYTGGELVRLLLRHAETRISLLTADRSAGKPLGAVFPHLGGYELPTMISIADADWSSLDVVFCALPHGTTQEVISALPGHLKVLDLSADFRLKDPEVYAEWYGHAHRAVELQKTAVYGLAEINRGDISRARLVAVPGCYPTASQLPLIPLLEEKLIDPSDIIIDAKSGVSGAGRAAKEGSLFTEVTEGIHAYGVASHRHAPEIEQGLAIASGQPMRVNFTPHLMPMSRGILATTYVRLAHGASVEDVRGALVRRYQGEPFVRVLAPGEAPATRNVRGSNYCVMNVFADRIPGRAIVISAIDNLVKGASGQAVQDMNIVLGFPEILGLDQAPMFP